MSQISLHKFKCTLHKHKYFKSYYNRLLYYIKHHPNNSITILKINKMCNNDLTYIPNRRLCSYLVNLITFSLF